MALRGFVGPLLTLPLVLAGGALHAGVIVVDPAGGPGGAALLQSAIDAAQPGDILLLRSGDYASLPGSHPQVVDKSLALIVDGPPGSVVLTGLQVGPADPGTVVLVRGLHVAPGLLLGLPFGTVEVGTGVVPWFEDCTFTGSRVTGLFTKCTTQTLVRCTITGADGADEVPGLSPAMRGTEGAFLLGAGNYAASIHECTFRGGRGGDGDPFVGGGTSTADGGAGLECAPGAEPASILGSVLLGGDEGDNNPAATQPGPGLRLTLCNANRRDTEIHAGSVNGAGTPSDDIVIQVVGMVTDYPAPARGLSVPSPLREGQGSLVHAYGQDGDGVWVFLGLTVGLKPFDFAQGNLVLGAVLGQPTLLGLLGPSGLLDSPVTMPNLPSGVDGLLVYMQSAMTPAGGGVVLGSGSALAWIDQTL